MHRSFFAVVASTVASNVSMLMVVALAPFFMSATEFAQFSLLLASATVASLLLELGVNTSVIVKYQEARDTAFFTLAMVVRGVTLALAVCVALAISASVSVLAVALLSGATTNVWTTLRAIDHARGEFAAASVHNAWFALARLSALVPMVLETPSWVVILCVYLVPVLVLAPLRVTRTLDGCVRFRRAHVKALLAYARPAYVGGIAYSVLPYLPQFHASTVMSAFEVGAIGLLLAFTTPIAVFAQAAQSLALPVGSRKDDPIGQFTTSPRFLTQASLATVVACAAVILLGGLVDWLYGLRFPGIGEAFLFFGGGYAFAALLGLYNVRSHALGLPQAQAVANWARLLVLLLGLTAFGADLLGVALTFGLVVLCGEAALAMFLCSVSHQSKVPSSRE